MYEIENSDWEDDLAWYDTEQYIDNNKGTALINTKVHNLKEYEETLEEKHMKRERINLTHQENKKVHNQWEMQKMGQAGLLKNGDLENDLDDDQGIILEVKDPDPEFLKNKKFSKLKKYEIKTCKDPTSDMALLAKNGSAILKRFRDNKESMKSNERFWDISKSNLGKVMGLDKPENKSQNGQFEEEDSDSKSSYLENLNKLKSTKGSSDFSKSKSIKEQREYLPVYSVRNELMDIINNNKIVIVVGETGSGKTTQLTQYMMEDGYGKSGIIGCTQPRRVAAVSVAKRVAEEVGCNLGERVGYSIRFEDCCTSKIIYSNHFFNYFRSDNY